MDTTRIPPAGNPFTVKQVEFTAEYPAVVRGFASRRMVVVYEGMHDDLGVEAFAERESKSEKD